MAKIIDNHCHFEQLTKREQKQALANYQVVGVASDYQSSLQLLALKKEYNDLSICLGIHPERINNYTDFLMVAELIETHCHQLVGIGEIGLPYFSLLKMSRAEQVRFSQQGLILFEKFVKLAAKLDQALNLHCVGDDTWQAISYLERYRIKNALFHWFAGSHELIAAIYEKGWFISVSPEVITNIKYQNQVKMIPKEILCLESDGPWLYQGQRGIPEMMIATAQKIALLFNCSLSEILQTSQRNAYQIWRIK